MSAKGASIIELLKRIGALRRSIRKDSGFISTTRLLEASRKDRQEAIQGDWLSPKEVHRRVKELGLRTEAEAVEMVREDRDGR